MLDRAFTILVGDQRRVRCLHNNAILDTNGDGQANDFTVDEKLVSIAPTFQRGLLTESVGKSFALSQFLDTGNRLPRYTFDGSDPVTGQVVNDPDREDIEFRDEIPRNPLGKVLRKYLV